MGIFTSLFITTVKSCNAEKSAKVFTHTHTNTHLSKDKDDCLDVRSPNSKNNGKKVARHKKTTTTKTDLPGEACLD